LIGALKAVASAATLQNGLLHGQAFVRNPGLSAAEDLLNRGRPQDVGNDKPPGGER
jgi:hypothetical protein